VLLRWLSSKESTCQCRRQKRLKFYLWAKKILWRRKWQPTPVFLLEIPWTEKPGRLQSIGVTKLDMIKHACIILGTTSIEPIQCYWKQEKEFIHCQRPSYIESEKDLDQLERWL